MADNAAQNTARRGDKRQRDVSCDNFQGHQIARGGDKGPHAKQDGLFI